MTQESKKTTVSAKILIRTLFRIFYIGSLATSCAIGQTQKLASDLQRLPASAKVDVIVQFVTVPEDGDIAALERQGAKLKVKFKGIRAGLFSVPVAALSGLAANPRVVYLSPD